MKELVHTFKANPNFERILKWSKIISITGLAQITIQAIGLVSGILVIRLLPTEEYALYTLANTMLGTMTILADGGISTAVMAQGGRVWNDKDKLGEVLVTGMNLRKRFVIISLIVAVPFLLFLLRHHGASWIMTVLLLLSLVPAFLSTLSSSFLQVAPKLQQDIAPLQRNQVEANIGRLAMLLVSLFVFPWAYIAILASGIPQIWANFRLKSLTHKYANWQQAVVPSIEKEIIRFVKRVLPGAIYYCVSGQITIWLISIFGSTTAVAQVGALSRLAMMLSVFNAMFTTLVLPRFARLPNNKNLILRHYLQLQVGLLVLCTGIVGMIWLFPSEVLMILGDNYANLETELILSAAGSCLSLIVGSSFSLSTSRGWALNPFVSIITNILAIVLGILLIDISSIKGILMLNILIALVELAMYFIYCLLKINKINNE